MSPTTKTLLDPPIIEAILDVDCDMPIGFDLAKFEDAARRELGEAYATVDKRVLLEHQIELTGTTSTTFDGKQGLQALLFKHADEKQIVQFRTDGYSFNRLAPYATLDDYLPEIERTWRSYVTATGPVQVRRVALRNINRVRLPIRDGELALDDYLKLGPGLPDDGRVSFLNLTHHYLVSETDTGNTAQIVVATEDHSTDELPVIIDVATAAYPKLDPSDWKGIVTVIESLRCLKNYLFTNTLRKKCRKRYRLSPHKRASRSDCRVD